jgi:peptidyl-prolyl cis-trans isomerase B (cyclophilin B)
MVRHTFLFLALLMVILSCKEKDQPDEVKEETRYSIGQIETRLGSMYFWLYDETPNHKAKFIELTKEKHYDQFTMNRVVKNFVVQGGCPDSPQYFTDSPYLLDPEFHDSIGHTYGALGMGRDDNPGKQSNACQLYVVCKEAGTPFLDSNYMIFGMLIKGEEVLEAIEAEPTSHNDQPLTDIPLQVRTRNFTKKELLDSLGFELP